MKKVLSLLICLLMLCGLLIPVSADAPLEITMHPQNYQYPEYSVAIYTVKASGTNLSCTWYIEYEGSTYNMSDNTNGMEPWEGYAGENYGSFTEDANTFSWFFGGIEAGLDGAQIYCVIEDGHNDITSERAIITVQGDAMPPSITDMPVSVTAYRGDQAEIRCIASAPGDSQLAYTWYETSSGKLQDIRAIDPEETGDYLFVSTESPGVRYYVCGITTSDGGRAYSSVVPVIVLDSDPEYFPEMEILTKTLPDATVGRPYAVELKCNDPYGLFTPYYNPNGGNELEESGLWLTKENFVTGTPVKAGTFTFSVCASGDYGEEYMEYTITVKEADQETETTVPEAPDATAGETGVPETEGTTGLAQDISKPDSGNDSTDHTDPADDGISPVIYILIGFGAAALIAVIVVIIILKKKK